MKPLALLPILILIAALGACVKNADGRRLDGAQATGSPFTRYLANEYRLLSQRTRGSTSEHFAHKGLAAVDGMIVAPETTGAGGGWFFLDGGPNRDASLSDARMELLSQLDAGGRDLAPDKAAMAQSYFDCWATGARSEAGDRMDCRDTFWTAMIALKKTLGRLPPPIEVSVTLPASPGSGTGAGAVKKISYLVFFDWNKDKISAGTRAALDDIAEEIKAQSAYGAITISGHTDTSGGETRNRILSVRRADVVRQALVARGIDPAHIKAEGFGETEPLVKTRDGIREPQNRRAKITVEQN